MVMKKLIDCVGRFYMLINVEPMSLSTWEYKVYIDNIEKNAEKVARVIMHPDCIDCKFAHIKHYQTYNENAMKDSIETKSSCLREICNKELISSQMEIKIEKKENKNFGTW